MKKILFLMILLSTFLFSNIGKITALSGTAYLDRNDNNLNITTGMKIHKSDIIYTNNNSKLQILFKDNSVITLGKNAQFKINDYEFNPKNPKKSKANFKFLKGAFKTITGKIGRLNKKNYKLSTKSASIGIRGSIGAGNQDKFFTLDGAYGITKGGVTVELPRGMMTDMSGDTPTAAREFTQDDLGTLGLGIKVKKASKKEKSTKKSKKDSTSKNSKKEDSSTQKEENSEATPDSNSEADDTTEPEQNKEDQKQDTSSTSTPAVETPIVESTETTDVLESSVNNKIVETNSTNNSTERPTDEVEPTITVHLGKYMETTSSSLSAGDSKINLSYKDTKLYDSNLDAQDGTITLTIEDTEAVLSSGENYTNIVFTELIEAGFKSPITPSLAYKIYTENQNEFFIVYGTTQNNVTSSLLYGGLQPNRANLNNTYDIFISDHYKSLLKNNPLFVENSHEKIVYNSQTKKGTNLTYQNKYNSFEVSDSNGSFTGNTYTSDESNMITGSLCGNNSGGVSFQGVGFIEENDNTIEKISTYTHSQNSANQSDKEFSYTANTDLSESTQASYFSSFLSGNVLSSTFSITFDENNSTDATVTTAGNLMLDAQTLISLSSSLANDPDSSSYFINDDLFGTTLSGHTTTNPSYLFSIADRIDENDNPIFVDDASSWGYWTKFDGTASYIGSWVSGAEIDMSSIINDEALTKTYNTQGHMIGYVKNLSNNQVGEIILDSDNVLNLNFDLGGGMGSFSGNFNFSANINGSNVTYTSASLGGNTNQDGTFTINNFSDESMNGAINGAFYGASDLQSTGGEFDLNKGQNYNAKGTFKTSVTSTSTSN